ncbi:carbamoyltransferase [Sorangium cellulosum]|uniref:Carbamoyltransferase n=1 Tax=Sorangium cellulosum TaxID=56 RepID=A0A2L0ELW4_SORCE|nr:carbamoyltransferase N-terminal domain-containing protein [Sorangium cellulosum]AUX40291.1 carbamoyltransferase [Sorangium cellulosum]
MSAVLGISAYYHDSAAALIVDGEIVAAMQEERFSRRKNDAALPRQAAFACLAEAGLAPGDLDRVVFYEDPFARLERVLLSLIRTFPRSWRQFPSAIRAQVGSKIWVLDGIAGMLGIPRDKVTTTSHHRSHAASAFFASPYRKAAVLTVDGMGEDVSTGMWLGEDTSLTCLGAIEYPHSIGLLYAALTAYLGFEVNEGEYKVMGLAAFGKPRFKDEFAKLLMLRSDGSFELGMPYFAFHTDSDIAFGPKMEALLGRRRPRGKAWDLDGSEEDRRYADIAASLQWATEEALVALAREAQRRTGCEHLCLAGGVALNCVANARILKESGFSRVFVQPAAGDAGGALGAAMLGAIELDGRRPKPMTTAALGAPVSNDAARELADKLGLEHTTPSDVLCTAAELVAQGNVVALARGRFEWGPRALGQRSILAAPQEPAMRERLNRAVKKREPFRPFAPAVLSDRADRWFSEHDNDMAPYMTTIGRVRESRASELGAITHVDGTARVQTVDGSTSPDLHRILEELEKKNGVPISLNTSLNGNGEPIVGSESDAIGFFVSHSVDAMIVGDILLQKRRK